MNKSNNFSLKLSKEKIELLVSGTDGLSHTIGYAEPNKPDLSKNLNILLNQVKSLTDEHPIVDVLLPDDLILQKNLTIAEPLSDDTAATMMAVRREVRVCEGDVVMLVPLLTPSYLGCIGRSP